MEQHEIDLAHARAELQDFRGRTARLHRECVEMLHVALAAGNNGRMDVVLERVERALDKLKEAE